MLVPEFKSPLTVVQSIKPAPALSPATLAIAEIADRMAALASDAQAHNLTPLTFGFRDVPTEVFDELVLHFDLSVSRVSRAPDQRRMALLDGALLYEGDRPEVVA